jgi:uncharacterized protein (DUF4415 family)
MSLVHKTRAELKDFRLTPKQQARLDALTDAQITKAARSDPDNPPITAAEFSRMRRPGRPPLAAEKRKVSVTLRLDPKVAAHFRGLGRGWQTHVGEVLLRHVGELADRLGVRRRPAVASRRYAKKFSVNKAKAKKAKRRSSEARPMT